MAEIQHRPVDIACYPSRFASDAFDALKFPIAIHKDEGSDYGVIVPDFPGCHSWGETIGHAVANSVEAIEFWVESAIQSDMKVEFNPSTVESLRPNSDYADAIWALVDIDPSKFNTKKPPG